MFWQRIVAVGIVAVFVHGVLCCVPSSRLDSCCSVVFVGCVSVLEIRSIVLPCGLFNVLGNVSHTSRYFTVLFIILCG